jgi:hypothetical protein
LILLGIVALDTPESNNQAGSIVVEDVRQDRFPHRLEKTHIAEAEVAHHQSDRPNWASWGDNQVEPVVVIPLKA